MPTQRSCWHRVPFICVSFRITVLPDDSMLLMMASNARMTRVSLAPDELVVHVILSFQHLLDEEVSIKLATVNADWTSPPAAVQAMPTMQELNRGMVPATAIRFEFHPSTNSTACLLSSRRSLNTHWIQSSALSTLSGFMYANIISCRTKSSNGTTTGRVVGVYCEGIRERPDP